VVALGNTADGRLTAVRLPVVGIWVVKVWRPLNGGLLHQPVGGPGAARRRGLGGVLVLRQKDDEAPSAPLAASLNAFFAREGIAAEAYTWEEMGGPFIGGVVLTRFVASITDLIMMVIIAAGILNTR